MAHLAANISSPKKNPEEFNQDVSSPRFSRNTHARSPSLDELTTSRLLRNIRKSPSPTAEPLHTAAHPIHILHPKPKRAPFEQASSSNSFGSDDSPLSSSTYLDDTRSRMTDDTSSVRTSEEAPDDTSSVRTSDENPLIALFLTALTQVLQQLHAKSTRVVFYVNKANQTETKDLGSNDLIIEIAKAVLSAPQTRANGILELGKSPPSFSRCGPELLQYLFQSKKVKQLATAIISNQIGSKAFQRIAKTGQVNLFIKSAETLTALLTYRCTNIINHVPYLNARTAFCGNVDVLSKEQIIFYSQRISLPYKILEQVLRELNQLSFINPIATQKKLTHTLTSRFKLNTLNFIVSLGREEQKTYAKEILKLISFVKDLLSCPEIQIYLSELDNDRSLLERFFHCIRQNQMILISLTCPDYSGTLNEDGVWEYDFQRLGTGPGFISERAIDYVATVSNIAMKYIDDVQIKHTLPSFEVRDGFKGAESLSFSECLERLQTSLRSISSYYEQLGHYPATHLTNEFIPDDTFSLSKQICYQQLIDSTDLEVQALLKGILKHRMVLYQRWYKQEESETEVSYQERLYQIVCGQVAEYMTIGRALTETPTHVMLTSDSSVMSEVFTKILRAVLFGKSSSSRAYFGD